MRERLRKYCGSMQQEIYARPVTYTEGRARGMSAIEVKCGDLLFHVMADKCLDISDLSYRGMNMTFLAKPGLIGRNHFDTNGGEAQRSIMGGLFFTCGYENICAPCEFDGKAYPMHGRMRTSPAEHVRADVVECEEGLKVVISGEIREAELFGENIVLRRTIESVLGQNTITLKDEVENQSFKREPLMLLYHCNAGYPFLDENAELVLPTANVKGREQLADDHIERWNRMDPPKDNEPEYVYIHDMQADAAGNTSAMLVNRPLETALRIDYNTVELPYFMEWKSTASGDYVVGLEPANSSVYGRPYHTERGDLAHIEPGEKKSFSLRFAVVEGMEAIGAEERRIKDLLK